MWSAFFEKCHRDEMAITVKPLLVGNGNIVERVQVDFFKLLVGPVTCVHVTSPKP